MNSGGLIANVARHILGDLRGALATSLEASGLLWRRLDRVVQGRVIVLMYHRVLPLQDRDSFSAPGIMVTPETFDRHLGWIQTHFNPLTPAEFSNVLDGTRRPPRRACLVTFDDGWFDNFAHALPALNRHGVPALFFAATGFVGTTNCFWQERLSRMLHTAWKAGSRGSGLLARVGAATTLNRPEQVARAGIHDAVARQKSRERCEILSLMQRVAEGLAELGIAPPTHFGDDRFMSWAELQHLAESRYATVGSHAVTHFPLPKLSPKEREEELAQSRITLEAHLRRKIDWFAYPNGSHDSATAALVRAMGYRGAFTTEDGPVAPSLDSFALQRVNIHEGATSTLGRFVGRLSGM